MKLTFFLASILFLIVNISIPANYRALEVFNAEASIELGDFFESTDNDSSEDQNNDISEEEVEIFSSSSPSLFYSHSILIKFITSLPIFISSYLPSIDIPPLF